MGKEPEDDEVVGFAPHFDRRCGKQGTSMAVTLLDIVLLSAHKDTSS